MISEDEIYLVDREKRYGKYVFLYTSVDNSTYYTDLNVEN